MSIYYWNKLIKKQLMLMSWALFLLFFLEGCKGCKNSTPTQGPSKSYQKEKNKDVPPGEPWGIPNLGNTCYMNASLQVLAAFYADMFDATRSGLTEEGKKLANAGKAIIEKINAGKNVSSEAAKEFFNVVSALIKVQGEQLKLGEQNDAHELLQQIFALLEFPMAGISYSYSDPTNFHATKQSGAEDFNILQGYLKDVGKPAPAQVDMQSCLASTVKEEQILDYKWGETEDTKTIADRKSFLTSLDKLSKGILPIQAARFDVFSGSPKKIKTEITNSLHCTLKMEYMLGGKKDISCDLVGFIVHLGSYGGGHYIAYVKKEGTWYCANDNSVTKVTMQDVEKAARDGYLYFYKLG
jgi:ubiquitin C-terminal hydrolase